MSDAFDQAMAGMGGGAPAPSPAPTASPNTNAAPALPNDPYGAFINNAAQTYNVDPRLIRAVIQTESRGRPKAVSSQGAVGLMQVEPDTAKGMGVHGDLTDPQTNIMAGTQLLSQLLGRYNDPVMALRHYQGGDDTSKWGPQNAAYPGKVLQNFNQIGAAPQASTAKAPAAASAPTSAAPAQASAPQPDAFDSAMAGMQQPAPAAPAPAPQQKPQLTAQQQAIQSAMGLDPISSAMNSAVTHGLSGLAGGIAGLGAGALKAITTGGDFGAANQAWNQTAGKVSGAIENALTPAGSATAQNVGRAVADVPGQIIGAVVDKGSDLTGQAAQGMGASADTARKISDFAKFGANAALTVGGTRALLKGREAPAAQTADQAAAANAQGAPGAQPQPGTQPQAAPPSNISPEAAAKPRFVPNGDGTFTQVTPGAAAQPSGTAAPMSATTLPPAASARPADMFPSPDKAPTVSGTVSDAEQAQRRGVINALGLDRVRDSVINGDPQQAGVEYQNAKVSSPIGDVTRATIADEQNAIRNYAQGVNDMTGRDPMLGPEAIGQKILAPLQKMSDWFDAKAGDLYSQAREQAGNVPLAETPELTNLLGDLDLRDRMAASPERQSLYNAVQSRFARFTGLADQAAEDGSGAAAAAPPARTIANAENFRQWLNAVGRDNPQSGQFISQVKQALDTDVASAGGQGLFDQARSMWQQRQQMLADPGQVAKLLGDQDGTGLNRNVPLEKVGQRVMSMDGANFRNLLGSLSKIEKMAPELAPDVQGSIAEIRGQAAQQLTDAGGKGEYWNANQFSKTAQTMAPKLGLIFNPEEIGAMRTLNEAGRIIRQPGAYPGAAAQHMNMFRSGLSTALPYAAHAAGSFIGGPVGGLAGQFAGNRLSGLVTRGGEAATAAKLAKRYAKNVQP